MSMHWLFRRIKFTDMFGSEYSSNPQLLLSSFGEMHASYKKRAKKAKPNFFLTLLQKIYIKVFGIPEIGFQVRSMYFEDIIEGKLKSKKFEYILDAGSGIGIYALWLAKRYPKAKVIGGDIDQEKLLFSSKFSQKENVDNVIFKHLDVTKSPQKTNAYDLIVTIDVLEHIENYKVVLKHFNKQLAPRGFLYLHTPQPHQTRIFKSLKKWSHEGHVHEGYTPQELKSELENLGYKVLVVRQTFGYFGKLAWELNHLSFKKGFVIAGLVYPALYLLACLDLVGSNRNGLGTAILAQKK